MMIIWLFALCILGAILAISAGIVVQATSYIAKKLQVTSFLFGYILLGFVTTIPEMFVAGQAIHDGIPQISAGNLLGGSILLLSFVMGASAFFLGRIILNHSMSKRDIAFSSFVIGAPSLCLWDGKLTRIEGLVLLIIYILHILFFNREQHIIEKIEHHAKHVRHLWHAIGLFILGITGIALSSRFLISIAKGFITSLGISPFIIGLFLVTFGTNLPELTLAWKAIIQKKRDIAFGDILGSSVVNTPILGIVCIIAPFSVPDIRRMRITLLLLAFIAVFFYRAASMKNDITKREGAVLLFTYLLFVLFEMQNI